MDSSNRPFPLVEIKNLKKYFPVRGGLLQRAVRGEQEEGAAATRLQDRQRGLDHGARVHRRRRHARRAPRGRPFFSIPGNYAAKLG